MSDKENEAAAGKEEFEHRNDEEERQGEHDQCLILPFGATQFVGIPRLGSLTQILSQRSKLWREKMPY